MPITVNIPRLDAPKFRTAARGLLKTSDGDTPQIRQPIRMLSCDTPEKEYAGGPEKAQETLKKARDLLMSGAYNALPGKLREYLVERVTDKAAANHIAGAHRASEKFERLQKERLGRPSGNARRLAVMPRGEVIDTNCRLLAFIAPHYANTPSDPLPPKGDPRRNTFNLNMIASGWAAFFPVYPSLGDPMDFDMAAKAAERAWEEPCGPWKEFDRKFLLGYEFRMLVKLARAKTPAEGLKDAFQRHCVDMRSWKNHGLYGFPDVPPPYRLWIWDNRQQLAEATQKLNLSPA